MRSAQVWVMALSLTAMVISLSFNQFFPTLTKTLGYTNTISLLLCAPPFVFATSTPLRVACELRTLLTFRR